MLTPWGPVLAPVKGHNVPWKLAGDTLIPHPLRAPQSHSTAPTEGIPVPQHCSHHGYPSPRALLPPWISPSHSTEGTPVPEIHVKEAAAGQDMVSSTGRQDGDRVSQLRKTGTIQHRQGGDSVWHSYKGQ